MAPINLPRSAAEYTGIFQIIDHQQSNNSTATENNINHRIQSEYRN